MQRHFREQIAFQTKFFFSLTDSDCGIFALRVNQCFVNSLSVPCCVYLRLPTFSLFQFKSRSFTLGSLLHSSSFGLSRNLVCVGRDANSGEDCVTIVCDFISIICMHTFNYSVPARGSISEYLPYGNKWRSYKKLRLQNGVF